MKTYHLDTNVVVRFLTHDDPKQWPAAEALMLAARDGKVTLLLDPVVVSELTYANLFLTGEAGRRSRRPWPRWCGVRVSRRADPGILLDALKRYGARSCSFATPCWQRVRAPITWPWRRSIGISTGSGTSSGTSRDDEGGGGDWPPGVEATGGREGGRVSACFLACA